MDHSIKVEMPNVAANQDEAGEQRQGAEHVKRPMNAFMVWAKTERRQLAMRLPGMPNSEVSKLLGEMWRQLSDEQKDKYRSESEKIRRKHKQEHPDYRYHPNRHSRKTKLVDASSPLAASLIHGSKHHPQQQRSLTPTGANQRMMTVKDDGRPRSAPPDSRCTMPLSQLNGGSVSSWWSPASTPPTSTLASGQNLGGSPLTLNSSYQTMPGSPTQDLNGLSSQSSVAWAKQNSPSDSHHSANSAKQRASPCSVVDQQRAFNQSPLVGQLASRQSSSLNNSSSSINIPVGGSLMPTVSGTYFDKTSIPYMAQEQPASTVSFRSAEFHRMPQTTTAAPPMTVASNDQQQRGDPSVLAPGTLFYQAIPQPTAYLPSTYNWLDNRAATFVLPEQLANSAQHGQMYHQQSVAS